MLANGFVSLELLFSLLLMMNGVGGVLEKGLVSDRYFSKKKRGNQNLSFVKSINLAETFP